MPNSRRAPVSPELALVDPALRESERARDQSWTTGPSLALRPVAESVSTPRMSPAYRVPRARSPRRRRAAMAVALIAMVVLVTGSAAPERKAHQAQHVRVGAPRTTTPAPRPTSNSDAQVNAARPGGTARSLLPVAGGGYVFGSSSRFQVGAEGGSLLDFRIISACSTPITVRTIPLNAEGRFRFAGKAESSTSRAATVVVAGGFVTPTRAVGTFRVIASGCTERTTHFTATLS